MAGSNTTDRVGLRLSSMQSGLSWVGPRKVVLSKTLCKTGKHARNARCEDQLTAQVDNSTRIAYTDS